MMSSGGTIQGTSFWTAALGEHPAATPAAPAAPATWRKVRRPTGRWLGSDTSSSLVAGDALGELRAPLGLLPLLAVVAREAPAHGERRHLAHHVHLLHLAMALLAADAAEDVALVGEEDVVGDAVHADPLDGGAVREDLEERLQLRGDLRVL